MKNKMMLRTLSLCLAFLTASAFAVLDDVRALDIPPQPGSTRQCWFFDGPGQYGIMPEIDENPFGVPGGRPIANIQNMSGINPVQWTDNFGGWIGDEFKIFIDIPNQPIANDHKILTINMRYQGEISFLGVTGIHLDGTLELFDPHGNPTEDDIGDWKVFTQQFYIEPNPREEIVVIGLKGIQSPTGGPGMAAALDQICIDTICVPEPVTLALLGLGGLLVSKRKKCK